MTGFGSMYGSRKTTNLDAGRGVSSLLDVQGLADRQRQWYNTCGDWMGAKQTMGV